MPIVQNNINRVNRMIENILDQPVVIRVMSPVQPIANTLTSRYLDYAMPRAADKPGGRPVSYTVLDSDGGVSWEGDTHRLTQLPDRGRRNPAPQPLPRRPVAYSVVDAAGRVTWEGDTELLPLHLQRRQTAD